MQSSSNIFQIHKVYWYQGRCENNFAGGVRLNSPEFALLINCYIITDHYLLKRLKGRRKSMDIENFERARYSVCSIYPP